MKPWLLLPPKLAHDLAPLGLQVLAAFRDPWTPEWRPLTWRGLRFANRLGLAGGVDKDGGRIEDWWTFGPGFVEIGTVTPLPQAPNPGKIIDREAASGTLWNKMGFPGIGAEAVRANLRDLPDRRQTPVFVNIGKNRWTANEDAARDYVSCLETLGGLADAFVINISSPNTSGLRDLFNPENFRNFLTPLIEAGRGTPLLLKLSPDLSDEDLDNVLQTAVRLGIDGFIATNTTLARDAGSRFPNEGGISGSPLAARSKRVLARLIERLGSARAGKLIISVGGVMTPEDVFERLALGADLVQVYSTLVLSGPGFFARVASAHAPKN